MLWKHSGISIMIHQWGENERRPETQGIFSWTLQGGLQCQVSEPASGYMAPSAAVIDHKQKQVTALYTCVACSKCLVLPMGNSRQGDVWYFIYNRWALSERSYASDTLGLCVRADDWYGVWGAWLERRVGVWKMQEWKQHWRMVKRWTQHFSSWGMQSQRQEKRRLNWDPLFSLLWDKEHIWVSPNEVDEPRAYHTEGSKSEREKQISYIHTHTHAYGI